MYHIIVVDTTNIGGVENELNEMAKAGYKFVGILQLSNRAIIIMEKPRVGRPRNETGE